MTGNMVPYDLPPVTPDTSDMEVPSPITSFRGEHRFLSNFYPADVVLDGQKFVTVEHAYQAAKCAALTDRLQFNALLTAGEAKRLGASVQIRPDWDIVRLAVMRELLEQKFRIPKLGRMLLATGTAELIELNTWGDTYWGVCRGVGENHLGRLLMSVRGSLSCDWPPTSGV